MKKFFAAISATAMIFGAVAGLTACGDNSHEHVWDEGEITTAATCTADGVKTYKCTVDGCTESYTESVNKIAHVFMGDWTKVDGDVHARKCANCDAVDSDNATTHNYEEDTAKRVPATCHSDGAKTLVCDDCGAETTEDITERPDHEFTGDWVKVDDESHARKCANCEAVDENKVTHTYSDTLGYNDDGHWQVCSDCGYETEIAGHEWDDGKITTLPAFMQAGEITYTCSVCGKTKTDSIPANSTAKFADEFTTENQGGAWAYGYVDYSWTGGESFEFHKIETLNNGGDGWQQGGAEIKGGWINADSMTTIAYTIAKEGTVKVKVDFNGGTENTRLALRIGVKNSDGTLLGNPSFDDDENSKLLNVEKTFTLNAGDTVYFIFSNEGKVDGAYPNGSLDIILTVQ